MNPETASPSIRRTLRYIEWTILGMTFLVVKLNSETGSGYSPIPDFILFALLGAMAALSLIFPINRPLWQRQVYVFIEMLLIIPTKITEWNFELIPYFFVAKSCFLLNRKDAVITTAITGITWITINVLSLPSKIEFARLHRNNLLEQTDTKHIINAVIINDLGAYIACIIFVILLSFAVIAEQKSRKKVVVLAQQVETLAASLERSRIARDIHDSLGHTLTTLDIQLEGV